VFPTTTWNYGLVLDPEHPESSFRILHKSGALPAQPFTPETAPISIQAKARKIPSWQQDANGLVGKLPHSPVVSQEPIETVELIPMAAARLRITSFPVAVPGGQAN
jgi:hypothetical protein